ncbi:MAG: DNA polymerase III subunit beta [Lachnospirales bacterium]
MKIICKQETLLNNINIALKAITGRSTQAVLKCLLLDALKNFKIFATDLKLSIETKPIECEITQGGRIAVDARMFSDIIKRLPNENVSIYVDDQYSMTITCGKTEFNISGFDASEFPTFPEVNKTPLLKIGGDVLSEMISKTIFATSTNDLKPIFKGELFEVENNIFNLVALDGYRVAHKKINLENITENRKIVIPGKDLSEISRLIEKEEDVTIYADNQHAIFDISTATIITRLLDGAFLEYNSLFSIEVTTELILKKSEIVASLERALLLSREGKINSVKFDIQSGILKISSISESGNIKEELEVQQTGEDIVLGFNPRYLIEIFKIIDNDEIKVTFSSSASPCIIAGIGETQSRYIVLPLRLRK